MKKIIIIILIFFIFFCFVDQYSIYNGNIFVLKFYYEMKFIYI